MLAKIHVLRKGKPIGPFRKSQVEEMVRTGVISESDQYRIEGYESWKPVSHLSSLPAGEINLVLPPVTSKKLVDPDPTGHPGFLMRVGAHLIDTVILSALFQALAHLAILIVNHGSSTLSSVAQSHTEGISIAWLLFNMIVAWLYCALMESSTKRATLGKMALRIVVTDMEGQKISFARASVRHFSTLLSAFTLGIGFVMCAFTKQKQCLHDKIARTLLFKNPAK